jgi:putative transposase
LAPNKLWVADFTYVSTLAGWVYVAFVIDAYARRVLGWKVSSSMTTDLVLDAINQAIFTRHREGVKDLSGLIHHNDAGSQYTSVRFTERLLEAVSMRRSARSGMRMTMLSPNPSTGCTRRS